MRIAGKEVPRWVLAAIGVGVVVIVAAVAFGSRDSSQSSIAGLSAEQGGSEGSTITTSEPAQTAPKTETTQTAGSSGTNAPPVGSTSGGSDSGGSDSGGSDSGGSDSGGTTTNAEQTGYVVVKYWNDTVSKSPGDVQISVGDAVWKPSAKKKSEVGKVGPLKLNAQQELVVYPDGANGKSVSVTIIVGAGMESKDSEAVHVEVRDGMVRVLGNPVVNFEVSTPRS